MVMTASATRIRCNVSCGSHSGNCGSINNMFSGANGCSPNITWTRVSGVVTIPATATSGNTALPLRYAQFALGCGGDAGWLITNWSVRRSLNLEGPVPMKSRSGICTASLAMMAAMPLGRASCASSGA